jgi:membrane protease YdiL (CAAX protease family)
MCNEEASHGSIEQRSDTPAFKDIVIIYLFSCLFLLIFGSLFQSLHLLSGLVISELAFVVAPAAIYTIRNHYDVSRTFHVTPIRFKTVIIVIITTVAAFVLVGIIAMFQETIFPRSEDYQEIWETVLKEFHQVPLVITLLLVAVLPGVCEELLFRGFLLQGMRKKFSDMSAIIIVGILFGAFHIDPYRFLPVSLLGIVFGYMVIKTGSIFTGIVAHSTNNAVAVVISYAAHTVQNSDIPLIPPQSEEIATLQTVLSLIPITVIALIVFLVGLRALPWAPVLRKPSRKIEDDLLFSFHEAETEDEKEEKKDEEKIDSDS